MNPDEILEYRDGQLFWKVDRGGGVKSGSRAGRKNNRGYIDVRVFGKRHLLHRVVWYLHYGCWPDRIDHINGNKEDNRIENLRECTQQQNCFNRAVKKENSCGFKGVSWCKTNKRWAAQVGANEKRKHLGLYDCPADAATVYNFVADQYHGTFARLNAVPQPWLEGDET